MNDFRKPSRRFRRQAIDGILNAPSREAGNAKAPSRALHAFRGATSRNIGDFRQDEGYHPIGKDRSGTSLPGAPKASRTATPTKKSIPGVGQGPSMLHMSLPGMQDDSRKTRGKGGKKGPKRHHWWHTKTGKWSLRGALVVLVLFLGVGGFLGTKLFANLHKVFKGGGSAVALQDNVAPSQLKGEGDGRVNILLLGVGGAGHDGADLTDTILLVSIDPVNKTAAMVSIPRDLWVTVDGSSYKINATYSYAKQRALSKNPKDAAGAQKAGIEKLESVVSNVVDMPIHYYSLVDFQAFKQAVDTVGGVDANVPSSLTVAETLYDGSTGKNYKLDVQTGQQHFDGTRALFYARSRHTSPRGDFDRAERQKLLIQALSQKVLTAGTYTNPAKLSGLMSTFGNHVSTDMSINDALRLMQIGKEIGNKFESVDLDVSGQSVVTTGMISGQSVVLPVAGPGNYTGLRTLVHSKMGDGYLAKENAEVAVLNGTTKAGLAQTKAALLKYYGYTVGTVGSAPTQTYDQTVIVDLTGGKKPYTQNYLEKRFGVKVTTTMPDQAIQPGNASFIIILGRNETSNS